MRPLASFDDAAPLSSVHGPARAHSLSFSAAGARLFARA
jgi:hypothetical protein